MTFSRLLQIATVCAVISMAACARPEDPARAQLRARLKQPASMSKDEIARTFDEVNRGLERKTVKATQGGSPRELDETLRDIVLGMLTNRAGVFDEGLRDTGGHALRVFNAQGRPSNAELDAARKIFIDVETLLPSHFEFESGVASDEFTLELTVQ